MFKFKEALTSSLRRGGRQRTRAIAGSCWPTSWISRAGTTIGCDTRKQAVLVLRRYEAAANPSAPSTPRYDRVFPPPTVTPGLQASCPTSQCWPDVALSLYLTSNAKITSSQHELTTALSADRRRGGGRGAAMASTTRFVRLMSSLGTSRPQRSEEEPFPPPRPPCSGWLESNFEDLWQDQMVWRDRWWNCFGYRTMAI